MLPNIGILFKGGLIPSVLLNIQLASCSLIKLYYLLRRTAHLDKSIDFTLFLFATLGFLFDFFYAANNTIALFYKYFRIYDKLLKSLNV